MERLHEEYKTEQVDMVDSSGRRMEYLWQPVGEGVRLLRMYGYSLCARVPDQIEGRPVTEIGAYCFSASEHLPDGDKILSYGIIAEENEAAMSWTFLEEGRCREATMPSLSGRLLQAVELPDSVRVIHNAAFYNCRGLSSLSVGREITGIGSDVFMNCLHLDHLLIRSLPEEEHGLSLILERLSQELEVEFGPGEGKLLFPEYYEWLNEISPAHIFSRSIEGEGLRMRRAFQDRRIDFGKYDQCFSNVLVGESEDTILRIALLRLRWPIRLTAEMETLYARALKERQKIAFLQTLEERDLDMLHFLLQYLKPDPGVLSDWLLQAIAADWGEGSATLMEEKKKSAGRFAEKSFDFDDLEDFDDF